MVFHGGRIWDLFAQLTVFTVALNVRVVGGDYPLLRFEPRLGAPQAPVLTITPIRPSSFRLQQYYKAVFAFDAGGRILSSLSLLTEVERFYEPTLYN